MGFDPDKFDPDKLVPLVRQLTDRQLQVLTQLGRCRQGKEIADALHMSLATQKFHQRMVFARLGIRSASEAVRVAVAAKLV